MPTPPSIKVQSSSAGGMRTAAEANEGELAISMPLFNCAECSALPRRLDNGVTPLSEETAYCKTTIDRKPVFFSRKFSSGVVFDTLHILRMPVCTSVHQIECILSVMNSYRSSAAVMLYYLLLMTHNFSSSSCVIISLRRLQIEVGGIVMGMV